MKPPKALATFAAVLLGALHAAPAPSIAANLPPNDGLNHPPASLPHQSVSLIGLTLSQPLNAPVSHNPLGDSLSLFDTPTITSVRGRVVKVQVPAGYSLISLERRTVRRAKPWVPVATQGATTGEMTFRLRSPLPKRLLRAVGTKAEPTETPSDPSSNTIGTLSNFLADPNGAGTSPNGISFAGGNSLTSNSADSSLSLSSGSSAAAEPSRTVVESDIWKLRGDRLYVFNSYRGLQVLDVADPAHPGIAGSLYLPVSGADQLYVPDDQHAVLLTHNPSNFQWNQDLITGPQSAVLVCDVSAGTPRVTARLALDGQLLESRMIGSALYVATQVYSNNQWYGRAELHVTGFDLRDPANPVQRNTVKLSLENENSYSYFSTVQASDHFFLVASNIWTYNPGSGPDEYRTRIGLVDISAPDGTVALRGKVSLEGIVQDKFKMQERGGVLSVVSDHSFWPSSSPHTHLENFSLANPNQPKTLGELDLGANETTFATRFDGDRVYVVTFRQVDPLWIVDNSKPAKPSIAGHVQAPGYSTYIEPLGDRLVTIGFVNGRINVSLFNVSNPTDPQLLQQLPVSNQWSWSEAVWNEKAFTVLPGEGLIMVPVTESWFWNWDDYTTTPPLPESGVQLVDLKRDSLTLRGRITQPFAPRRTTLHRDTVLAFGDSSLLSADISDRDHPQIVSDLSLAWRTDFVWRSGQYLLEIGGALQGGGNVLTVASPEYPDAALSSLPLGDDPVVAADLHDGYVYVLQQGAWYWSAPNNSGSYVRPAAHLSIYNVDSAPVLVKTGEVTLPAAETLGYALKCFWPTPGTLVVTDTQRYYSILFLNDLSPVTSFDSAVTNTGNLSIGAGLTTITSDDAVSTNFVGSAIIRGPYWPYWPRPSEKKFFTFDVTAPDAPVYLGAPSVQSKSYANFSDVFCADGKLFLTHQYIWPIYYIQPILLAENIDGTLKSDSQNLSTLYGRHFLDVLDFSTPSAPVVRPPVSAPGVLEGIARQGTRLFFIGPDYQADGHPKSNAYQVVHAGKYDGTKVTLAATLNTGTYYSGLIAMEDRLFISNAKPRNGDLAQIDTWLSLYEYSDGAGFTLLSEIIATFGTPAVFGDLLLSREYTGYGYGFRAVDFSNPNQIRLLGYFPIGWSYTDPNTGTGTPTEGFWFPLGIYGTLHIPPPPR